MTEFYNSFLTFIELKYPSLREGLQVAPPSETLISQARVKISAKDLQKITTLIKELFKISREKTYVLPTPHNFSVFMSYDFHITPTGPRLIEVNTNASQTALAALLTEFQGVRTGFLARDFFSKVKDMFESEARLFFGQSTFDGMVIADERPTEQRAYTEFLIYKRLFSDWGWRCEICDVNDLVFDQQENILKGSNHQTFQAVYNRTTDFYFEQPQSRALKKAYESQKILITPQPNEYARLADKDRLIEWSNFRDQNPMLQLVPDTKSILDLPINTPRDEKKRWFFKPRQSYGGRAAYKGASVSSKTWNQIYNKDFIAQEFIEAPTIDVIVDGSQNVPLKWDLRAYVYRAEIQLLIARIYQGQVTNAQTPGGGLGAVIVD